MTKGWAAFLLLIFAFGLFSIANMFIQSASTHEFVVSGVAAVGYVLVLIAWMRIARGVSKQHK